MSRKILSTKDLTIFTPIADLVDKFTKLQIKKIEGLFDKIATEIRLIDLLLYLPRQYTTYARSQNLSIAANGSDVVFYAKVIKHAKALHFKKSRTPYSIMLLTKDDTKVVLKFFRYNAVYLEKFAQEKVIQIRGKLTFFKGTATIIHPSLLSVHDDFPEIEANEKDEIIPIYPLKNNIKKSDISKLIEVAIEVVKGIEEVELPSYKDGEIEFENKGNNLLANIEILHNPDDQVSVSNAIQQMAYCELLTSILAINFARKNTKQIAIPPMAVDISRIGELEAKFGHKFTNDQLSAINILSEKQRIGEHFFTLIQGDVGSGKTIVGFAIALNAGLNGRQTLFLAPTTILANQHWNLAIKLLSGFGIEVGLLTSKIGVKARREILRDFAEGKISILFGTHSLLSDELIANNLGLIVIDEQHRFGVKQRLKLVEKSDRSNIIMLSATPIPRSLAMAIYGDIDIIEILEKPKFQKPIKTTILSNEKYKELVEHLRARVADDERVYWICHLIDNEDNEEKMGVLNRYEKLKTELAGVEIDFLHGKMKEAEKNEIIEKFQKGETKMLISTTVVEVGVNIPEASIIIIENAQMFGLAQLHQLRGRVGRGERQSYCILLCDPAHTDSQRLGILKDTNNGFEIAQHDLKIRGTGNILGVEQSGDAGYRIANISRDLRIMQQAGKDAKAISKKGFNDSEVLTRVNLAMQIFQPEDYYKFLLS